MPLPISARSLRGDILSLVFLIVLKSNCLSAGLCDCRAVAWPQVSLEAGGTLPHSHGHGEHLNPRKQLILWCMLCLHLLPAFKACKDLGVWTFKCWEEKGGESPPGLQIDRGIASWWIFKAASLLCSVSSLSCFLFISILRNAQQTFALPSLV